MRSKLAVVAITLAVALLFSTMPAKAGKPTTIVTPIDTNIPNMCTGEFVHITGTITSSLDVEIKNGITHIRVHTVYDFDGVGLMSGNDYSLHTVQNQTTNGRPGGPIEISLTVSERFISQGSDDNLLIHANLHVTINANGEVTVNRTDTDIECVG